MTKIFIVEDDPLMSRMYEKAFRLNGYDVELAFDGEEGLKKLQDMDEKPSVVLLDIMMPKMSGFDVLKAAKGDKNIKKVPIIALTNLAGKDDAEKALKLGAALYLVKSQYDPREVVEKVKEVISKHK